MEQQGSSGGGLNKGTSTGTGNFGSTVLGGTSNTPGFRNEPPALATAADHQLPSDTGATGRSGGSSSPGTGSSQMKEKMGEAKDQAEKQVNQGMKQAADRIDQFAKRIDETADQKLGGSGAKGRAGDLAHSVADTMESVSGYLRSNDVSGLQKDLERQVRERPLQTLLIGVAAGWMVGKILR